MNSIPHDPLLPALRDLFPPVGAPSCVTQFVQEAADIRFDPHTAHVSYVRYQPTRDCVVLWSFPTSSGEPLLISGKLSRDELGSSTARSCFRHAAETARAVLGWKRSPYLQRSDPHLLLLAFPLDVRLPKLALACSPSWTRKAFSQTTGLTGDERGTVKCVPVSYKPWRRCVLSYLVESPGHRVRYFAKVFRDDRGQAMVERLPFLQSQLRASGIRWEMAAPVMYCPEVRTLVLDEVQDAVEMSDLIQQAPQDPRAKETLKQQIVNAAEGLATLRRISVDGLPCVGPQAVLAQHAEELEEVFPVAPALANSVQTLLGELEAAASDLPDEQRGLGHGAFRHGQLLVRGGTLVVLDWDGMCISGISADAGEFLSSLDVMALRRRHLRPLVPDCEEVFLGTVLKQPGVDPRWLAWHRAAGHVMYALRAFFRLAPNWPEVTDGLLKLAEQTLRGVGHSKLQSSPVESL